MADGLSSSFVPMPPPPEMWRALEPTVSVNTPEFSAYTPEPSDIPSKHPWKAERTEPNDFRINGGTVYGSEDTDGTLSKIEITESFNVEDVTAETWVWVEVSTNPDTYEITGGLLVRGAEIPDDTNSKKHRAVAHFYTKTENEENPYFLIDQREFADIYLSAPHARESDSLSSGAHEWQVTLKDASTEMEVTTYTWTVKGGDIYTQGGSPFTVGDVERTGSVGYVLLKITRDATSREITSAAIEAALSEAITTSDYTDQYIALAYIDVNYEPKVKQLQFERLNIRELMLVENGEFQLASFRLSSNNVYDTPPV